ncbi:MAG: FkbM family methyltransferase, partial [Oscillospiraceae bacterium]
GIFASDDFVRGHSFCGKKVLKFSEVINLHSNNFITLLSFASSLQGVMQKFLSMQNECEFYAPDVPVIKTDEETERIFNIDYIKKHEDEFDKVYSLLADEQSKKVFLNAINFKISGKINYLMRMQTKISEVYKNIIRPNSDDTYIDLGAYTGDTVSEFLEYINGDFCGKIFAFEPDKKNYKKLLKRIESEEIKNITTYNIASWDKETDILFNNNGGRNSKSLATKFNFPSTKNELSIPANSVDNLLSQQKIDIIKFDVEGAEEKALLGCKNTIQEQLPKLMLSAYHKNCDIFSLPLLIENMAKNKYNFYLRQHPYIPCWELNYYIIKK